MCLDIRMAGSMWGEQAELVVRKRCLEIDFINIEKIQKKRIRS